MDRLGWAAYPGIVVDGIQTSKQLQRRFDGVLDGRTVAHVTFDGQPSLSKQFSDRPLRFFQLNVSDDNAGSFARVGQRTFTANSLSATGQEDPLVCQFPCHS